MEFREHTLPNGLSIVAEVNPQAYSTSIGFFVETGARDETAVEAGVSHFLEHMVFKGTPTRTAEDVNREFDEMGAHYNAFTSEESTVYYAAVLPEYQRTAMELLSDIMRPSLREEDFDTEKQVIVEEIRMYEDQPPFCADEKCKAAFFGKHALGNSVLGTVGSVSDLSVDAMRSYFERRYSPDNISVVGTGKIDFEEMVATAQRCCGVWKPSQSRRTIEAAKGHSVVDCLQKEGAAQEYVIQLALAPAAEDKDRFAAKILATVLGDDSGSRLYWELIDTGLAEHASMGHYDYQGSGLFMVYLSCSPEQTEDNLARVARIFADVEANGVLETELQQAKQKVQSRVVLSGEKPRGRLFSVGGNWTQRREYRSVRDDLDDVAAVTVGDLCEVLTKYPLSRNTTTAIGPLTSLNGR